MANEAPLKPASPPRKTPAPPYGADRLAGFLRGKGISPFVPNELTALIAGFVGSWPGAPLERVSFASACRKFVIARLDQRRIIRHALNLQAQRRQCAVNEFARWRKECGLTVNETAELLGLTRGMVWLLEQGREPRVGTRKLMSVIAQGQRPTPWPVESVEQK